MPALDILLGKQPPSSEDCLLLNVWTEPEVDRVDRSKPSLKPVMLFFPGGGFFWGDSNNELYIGAHLAHSQGVVVVTAK
jgi:para-nitrobenzyl esterase